MQSSILITGASTGIGLRSAEILKARGYRVFATARKQADVEKLNKLGFESIRLDITDSYSIENALAWIVEKTDGHLDALFNNAGFLQAGAVSDLTRDQIRAQFETNVFGPMELIRLVLPIMRNRGHGRIIQNSSILGVITLPYYSAYNASKFALEAFSLTLKQELRGTNIHVSIINPGPIHSKLRENAYQHYQKTRDLTQTSHYEKIYKKMEKTYFHPEKKSQRLMQQPDVVVKKLIHALESKHPKTHYYVGFSASFLAFLRRILPDSALNWALEKVSFRE